MSGGGSKEKDMWVRRKPAVAKALCMKKYQWEENLWNTHLDDHSESFALWWGSRKYNKPCGVKVHSRAGTILYLMIPFHRQAGLSLSYKKIRSFMLDFSTQSNHQISSEFASISIEQDFLYSVFKEKWNSDYKDDFCHFMQIQIKFTHFLLFFLYLHGSKSRWCFKMLGSFVFVSKTLFTSSTFLR